MEREHVKTKRMGWVTLGTRGGTLHDCQETSTQKTFRGSPRSAVSRDVDGVSLTADKLVVSFPRCQTVTCISLVGNSSTHQVYHTHTPLGQMPPSGLARAAVHYMAWHYTKGLTLTCPCTSWDAASLTPTHAKALGSAQERSKNRANLADGNSMISLPKGIEIIDRARGHLALGWTINSGNCQHSRSTGSTEIEGTTGETLRGHTLSAYSKDRPKR
ncbi:hypothetical protein BJV74DRAFT_793353 [Russula compacta]|nr:hypothetical protein BJV74DRAFT_793353 [Russula compacta]